LLFSCAFPVLIVACVSNLSLVSMSANSTGADGPSGSANAAARVSGSASSRSADSGAAAASRSNVSAADGPAMVSALVVSSICSDARVAAACRYAVDALRYVIPSSEVEPLRSWIALLRQSGGLLVGAHLSYDVGLARGRSLLPNASSVDDDGVTSEAVVRFISLVSRVVGGAAGGAREASTE